MMLTQGVKAKYSEFDKHSHFLVRTGFQADEILRDGTTYHSELLP
jgi:hypothetical protein